MSTPPSREEFERLYKLVEEQNNTLSNVEKEFARYRGIVGGIILVFSAIATALGLAINWIKG